MAAILFDLDGTLLDRDASLKRFLEEQYDRFSGLFVGVNRSLYIGTVVELDRFGHVLKPVVYAQVREKFGLSTGSEQLLLEDFEMYFHSLAIPFPGMHCLLQELLERDWRLGLVTNGSTRSQRPKIEALGIADYFATILISEEQGVKKPDSEIYHRAMRELNAIAKTTIFVGDHPEADIAGAGNLGLFTIWKRNICWPPPKKVDAVIDGLDEIPKIVEAWRLAKKIK